MPVAGQLLISPFVKRLTQSQHLLVDLFAASVDWLCIATGPFAGDSFKVSIIIGADCGFCHLDFANQLVVWLPVMKVEQN